MFLLDADTLTLLFYRSPRVVARELDVPLTEAVAVPIITRLEVLRGRIDAVLKAGTRDEYVRAQTRLRETDEFLAKFQVVYYDDAALTLLARLRGQKGLRRRGSRDLLNASIAITHDATFVTCNTKHFADIPGLKLANWAD